jgi:hypothetical protein
MGDVMIKLMDFHPKYVTDEQGNKTAVMLVIDEFNRLMEDIADLAVAAERRDEPSILHHEVIAELKKDGRL